MKHKSFEQWLQSEGYAEATVKSRLSNLRKIEEYYPDLQSRIADGSIRLLLVVFNYTDDDVLANKEPLHKIPIEGNIKNGTNTYRSTLQLYLKYQASLINTDSKNYNESSEQVGTADLSYKDRIEKPFSKKFFEWLVNTGQSEGSARSYMSYLNSLNRNYPIQESSSLFEALSQTSDSSNGALAFAILAVCDEWLTMQMSSTLVDVKTRKNMSNWRSALRKYQDFLIACTDDLPDDSEIDYELDRLTNSDKKQIPTESGDPSEYSHEEIEKNFQFRLLTQNRMSNNKDVFYPIGIIRKLFKHTSEYAWLDKWVKNSIDNILVKTDIGELPLKQVETIMLYPDTGSVKIITNSDSENEFYVRTELYDSSDDTEYMYAERLRDVHIDHTPLMKDVLSQSIDNLKALPSLSKIIIEKAKGAKIDIKPKNFGKISKLLFADENVVAKLNAMIPDIKYDLNYLSNNCRLKLMSAVNNLKKK